MNRGENVPSFVLKQWDAPSGGSIICSCFVCCLCDTSLPLKQIRRDTIDLVSHDRIGLNHRTLKPPNLEFGGLNAGGVRMVPPQSMPQTFWETHQHWHQRVKSSQVSHFKNNTQILQCKYSIKDK